jgi:menaquinone-specific isochorismate synthase
LTPRGYADAVGRALSLISSGECVKIVLSRDVVVDPGEMRLADLIARLRRQSPDTWVFSIDGLVGATPELLGGAHDRRFYARVLAGSAPPEEADSLWASVKNQTEHAYAVASVTDTVGHLLDLSPHPTVVLKLPNIAHLSTELTADMHPGVGLVETVEAMHPTAAICGTPTATAARLLRQIEGFDRGRYGGPVGWLDAHGGGELALALRCGQVEEGASGARIRLYAGAGIVDGSDPDAEVAETDHKLRPMLKALGVTGLVR